MLHQPAYKAANLLRRFFISTGILCLLLVIIMLIAIRPAAVIKQSIIPQVKSTEKAGIRNLQKV